MVEGSRMWAIFLLTIMLFTLLSAAPIDITDDIKKEDVKADDDAMHSHDENVTRAGKFFGHNQFEIGNINVPGSVAGDDVSIGHEVNIDVQGHTHDHHHHEDDTVIECKEGLREMFKSIDSNKDGLMDAMELLGVCHQNNIQITKPLAVRILTLPDKMVGFNIAKFCELLKDCQSTNSADLIYFLLQLFDKGADVLELDAQNFHGVVSSYSYILVLFYAPWCPICKRLFPEYDAAAKILAEKPIGSYTRMAKIDATVHTALRDHYKIPGYPTMKLFYNGQEFAHLTGFQKANSIVDWLDSQRGISTATIPTTTSTTTPPGAWRQKNEADCWYKCGSKDGSCPTFCGVGGFCCRKGYSGCPAGAPEASPKYHTCVIQIDENSTTVSTTPMVSTTGTGSSTVTGSTGSTTGTVSTTEATTTDLPSDGSDAGSDDGSDRGFG